MLLPVFAILAVLGLWLWWYYMASYLSSIPLATVSSIEAWGTFGDSFGSLNTLFTGLAFIGLVYTIHVQRKEMKETSEVLKHEKKREAIRDFENTFFQLLQIHTENVRSTKYSSRYLENLSVIPRNSPPKEGQPAFNLIYDEFKKHLASDPDLFNVAVQNTWKNAGSIIEPTPYLYLAF